MNTTPPAVISASPVRHSAFILYEYSLTDMLKLGAGFNYRISTYPAVPGTAEREDTRERTSLRLTYDINKTWSLRAEIEQTQNDSNNPIYTYDSQVTSFSVSASF